MQTGCKECHKPIPAARRKNAKTRGRTALYDCDACAKRAARRAYRERERVKRQDEQLAA